MKLEGNSTIKTRTGSGPAFWSDWFNNSSIQLPGLTVSAGEVGALSRSFSKNLAVFFYKRRMPCLWVVFVGGTGTGKSTLFNAFCGKLLSATGVERPKTVAPIIYAHAGSPVESLFPLDSIQIERRASRQGRTDPATGTPGQLIILEHERKDWSHLVVVDTPDLDSVEAANREMAEDLYLISDAVVFVTSEEKYADDVPYRFLLRVVEDGKPLFCLFNKMRDPGTPQEAAHVLEGHGMSPIPDGIWLIPYAPAQPEQRISGDPGFAGFQHAMTKELSADRVEDLRKTQLKWRAEMLKGQADQLLDLLQREDGAARNWLTELDALCKAACHDLIREEKRRFTAESRKYIQKEIRRLFTKYDILAGPRRVVREIFLAPLRVFGLYKKAAKHTHKNALSKVREKVDFEPVIRAVEKFNRLALESLSPSEETAPIFKALRQPGVSLTEEEVKGFIRHEQGQLNAWIEKTFQSLSRGLSKQKKWGIYSTSVLWGILILSFEIVVGGGFTVLDAILDSTLAPFVTKGAVELFAYHEIQKTARELAQRYQEGLLSVVDRQRDRYRQCLQSLMTPEKTLKGLGVLQDRLLRYEFEPVQEGSR